VAQATELTSREARDELPRTIRAAVRWLAAACRDGAPPLPAPIELYFARLWYFEDLYPSIFAIEGLSAARRYLRDFTRETRPRLTASDRQI
jgi:hypothetical protein